MNEPQDIDDSTGSALLDQLAAGDLAGPARRELFAWLDRDVSRWRRCALSLLETRELELALDDWMADVPEPAPQSHRPARSVMPASRKWIARFVLVASLLVSFGLGAAVRELRITPQQRIAQPPHDRRISEPRVKSPATGHSVVDSSGRLDDDPNDRSGGLVVAEAQSPIDTVVSVPPYVRSQWEKQGNRIETLREELSVALSSGRNQFERWQKYYRSVAAEYDMEQGKEPQIKLKLRPEPVLSYVNSADEKHGHGAMFVWTRDGRPEILGAIWSRQTDDVRPVIHEMHSLSLEPLTATRNGNVFWSPAGPGIDPFPIPGAPEPAATPALRIAQMRSLTREFTAATVRGKVERQLQFRPQPVYRFDKPTAERDGAVFVGFEDWAPELLMLIEVRPTADGSRWHAGFARFTNLPVSARHKDVPVWSFAESPSEGAFGGFDKRFNAVHGVDVLPAVREE